MPLILTGCICLAYAQDTPSDLKATASLGEEELLMGKLMPLTVDVYMPSDSADIKFPLLEKAQSERKKFVTLGNDSVELLVKYTKMVDHVSGQPVMRYNLAIQSFDSGKYKIPELDFVVNGKTVKTNPLELKVIPVKAKADDQLDDFSDIVEPFEIMPADLEEELKMEEDSNVLLWCILGGSLLLLGIFVYYYLRYKKTGSLLRKPLPPYRYALNRLEKLRKENLPQKGKTKEYYTKLTEILRLYLNKQFGIKTFEKTSSEILSQIAADEKISNYETTLSNIFETADFVKFAKVNPSEIENNKCMERSVEFVENSHPEETEKGGEK